MATTAAFAERVDEVDLRLRELVPGLAQFIGCERRDDVATWRCRDAWGTLVLHPTDVPPRVSLLLYSKDDADEQNAVEASIDEADLTDVLAEPLAGLFRAQTT